jgi:hypothetical protein
MAYAMLVLELPMHAVSCVMAADNRRTPPSCIRSYDASYCVQEAIQSWPTLVRDAEEQVSCLVLIRSLNATTPFYTHAHRSHSLTKHERRHKNRNIIRNKDKSKEKRLQRCTRLEAVMSSQATANLRDHDNTSLRTQLHQGRKQEITEKREHRPVEKNNSAVYF